MIPRYRHGNHDYGLLLRPTRYPFDAKMKSTRKEKNVGSGGVFHEVELKKRFSIGVLFEMSDYGC